MVTALTQVPRRLLDHPSAVMQCSGHVFDDNMLWSDEFGEASDPVVEAILRVVPATVVVQIAVALTWRPGDGQIHRTDLLNQRHLPRRRPSPQRGIQQQGRVHRPRSGTGKIPRIYIQGVLTVVYGKHHLKTSPNCPAGFPGAQRHGATPAE